MSEPSPGTIELTCPGCGAYFRLKPKKGKLPKGPIPCPKCSTAIPIELNPGESSSSAALKSEPEQTSAAPRAPMSGVISKPAKSNKPLTGTMLSAPNSADYSLDTINPLAAAKPEDSGFGLDSGDNEEDLGPNSTFLGFGIPRDFSKQDANQATAAIDQETLSKIREHAKETRESHAVPPQLDAARADAGSTTDTSHFHKGSQPAIDPSVFVRGQTDTRNKALSEEDIEGLRATPVGGVDPLVQGSDFPHDTDEPGPFDLRDILEAERNMLDDSEQNNVTRNPALDKGSLVSSTQEPPAFKPLPNDGRIEQMSLGAPSTQAAEEILPSQDRPAPPLEQDEARSDVLSRLRQNLRKERTNPELSTSRVNEALASRSDIFGDTSSVADMPGASSIPLDEDLTIEKPKPLAAMIRRKFGAQKLDSLRDNVNEGAAASEEPSSPAPASPVSPPASPSPSRDFLAGADEDDLAKILDEANSKRVSGEHDSPRKALSHTQPTPAIVVEEMAAKSASDELDLHKHPTRPDLDFGGQLAAQLEQAVQKSEAELPASIGASYKQKLSQDRSPELEPGSVPSPASSARPNILARLRPPSTPSPKEADASDSGITKRDDTADTTPRSASGFERFDITSEGPAGISWAARESEPISNDSSQFGRKRRRQESHSGLFPISGGLGQESSVGMASERRGSGYIRLPTSEILDVLGTGHYRLLVEDIVYEPVDEVGLTELIKRGVLMGAEMIAEPGGEWRPINEHPVFRRLRKKMAIEAHALLAKYRRMEDEQRAERESEEAHKRTIADAPSFGDDDSPAFVGKQTLQMANLSASDFSNPTPSMVERLDDLSADLEESPSMVAPPSLPPSASQEFAQPAPEAFDGPEMIEPEEEEDEAPLSIDLPEAPLSEPSFPEELAASSEPALEERSDVAPLAATSEASAWQEEDAEPVARVERRNPWLLISLLIGAMGLLFVAGVLITQPEIRAQLFGTAPVVPVDPDAPVVAQDPTPEQRTQLAPALAAATQAVHQAAAIDLRDVATQQRLAAQMMAQDEPALAALLYGLSWNPSLPLAQSEAYAAALRASERFGKMRKMAMSGLSTGQHTDFFEALRKEALERDPAMRSMQPVEITKNSHGDSMTLVRAEKALVFKLTDARGQSWAFQPTQRRYDEDASRREVIAWRLCQLVVCDFEIPEVLPATMSREVFDHLMSADGGGAKSPSERYAELGWSKDAVGGVLKRWVEPGAYWPFDFTNTWRPWEAAYEPMDRLDVPFAEAIKNVEREAPETYTALMAQHGDMTTRQLARQISSMMVFDYLTNNMNRFSQRGAYNGALDNQLLHGDLYSLEHGTILQSRLSSRVQGRFDWVQRFDPAVIESIRALDPEQSGEILFPEQSGISRGEQQAFWKRRDALLKDVDALVAKYGKEQVMAFE